MKTKILLFAVIFTMASCSNTMNEPVDVNANAGEEITISVDVPSVPSNSNQVGIRRINGGIGQGGTINFKWEENDILKVSSLDADGNIAETQDFTISEINTERTFVKFKGIKPTVPENGKPYFKLACGPEVPPTHQIYTSPNLVASNMMRFENPECYLDKNDVTITLDPVWSVLVLIPSIYFHTYPEDLDVNDSYRCVVIKDIELTQRIYDKETDGNVIKTLTVQYDGDKEIDCKVVGVSSPNVNLPIVVYPADVYDLSFKLTYNDLSTEGWLNMADHSKGELKWKVWRYTEGATQIFSGDSRLLPGFAWNCGTPEASYTWYMEANPPVDPTEIKK